MNAVLTLLGKEIALYLRDRVAIAMTFVLPMVIIAVIGSIFGNLGSDGGPGSGIKLAALDLSKDGQAQPLIDALKQEEGLEIIESPSPASPDSPPFTRQSIRQGIVDGNYRFAIVFPPDFLSAREFGVSIDYLYNPVNQIETQIVSGLIQKNLFTKLPNLLLNQERLANQLDDSSGGGSYERFLDDMAEVVGQHYGVDAQDLRQTWSDAGGFFGPMNPESGDAASNDENEGDGTASFFSQLVEFNEDQVYGKKVENPTVTRIVGGYAVMFLLFAVTGSSTSLFEEKNDGLFLRLLSMPVGSHHILWSKTLFNAGLGVIQVISMFIGGWLLFDVQLWQHFPAVLIVAIAAALACTSFGMLLASISQTPAQAQGYGTLIIILMSACGGAWFPVSIMPDLFQAVSKFTLVYWAVEGFLASLWEGRGPLGVMPMAAVLLAIAAALSSIALWRFKTGNLFR